jgi:hypothetical protein
MLKHPQPTILKDTKDTDNEGHFVSFVALSGGEDGDNATEILEQNAIK